MMVFIYFGPRGVLVMLFTSLIILVPVRSPGSSSEEDNDDSTTQDYTTIGATTSTNRETDNLLVTSLENTSDIAIGAPTTTSIRDITDNPDNLLATYSSSSNICNWWIIGSEADLQDFDMAKICQLYLAGVETVKDFTKSGHDLDESELLSVVLWIKNQNNNIQQCDHDEETNRNQIMGYLEICNNIFDEELKEEWEVIFRIASPMHSLSDCEKALLALSLLQIGDESYLINFEYLNFVIAEVSLNNATEKFNFTDGSSIEIDFQYIQIEKEDNNNSVLVALILFTPGNILKFEDETRYINESLYALVSPILSCNVYFNGEIVSVPVTYSLVYTQVDVQTETNSESCRFWKSTEKNEYWDEEGCQLINKTDQLVNCHCNHTTNFAVLMQVADFEISQEHTLALSIISYIGCGISLVCLLVTFIIFSYLTALKSEKTKIHKNLIVALILAQSIFLIGISATDIVEVCKAVAILLHYFYLAALCWMLVEGLNLYIKVIQVFGNGKDKLPRWLLIGWGVPLVVVGITAATSWDGYGTPNNCWLSIQEKTIWAFVAPASAIVTANFIILIMVLKIVITASSVSKIKEYDHIKAGVKSALLLLPIMGISWIFGLLAVNKETIVFQYIFAICNSLQGCFIFLFHCVFNSEVKEAFRKTQERKALERGEFVKTSSVLPSQSDRNFSSFYPMVEGLKISKNVFSIKTSKLDQKDRETILNKLESLKYKEGPQTIMTASSDTIVERDQMVATPINTPFYE